MNAVHVAPRVGASENDWFVFQHALGLTADLLPVVQNQRALISPRSTIKELGKTPSEYNRAGQVRGVRDWSKRTTTASEVEIWSKHPDYGIGIQTREVRALDVDVTDPALAQEVLAVILEKFQGNTPLPRRFRADSPKFLIPFRMPGGFRKRVIDVRVGKIEFLATGEHFVAAGTHPRGARYEWSEPPYIIDARDPAQFEALWTELARHFEVGPTGTVAAAAAPGGWVDSARRLEYAHRDVWFEPMSDEEKVATVRAIAATWTAERATDRDEWFKCIRSIADAVNRGLDRETGIDVAEEFSRRSTGAVDDRDTIEQKMFEGGVPSSIYAAAAMARVSVPAPVAQRPALISSGTVPVATSLPKPPAEARIDYTDKGNANLLVQQANGDLRYVSETKQWLRWSGARWQIDTHEVFVTTYAVNVAEHYFEKSQGLRKGTFTYNQAEGTVEFAEDVFKWAGKCRSKKALDAMIGLARKAPGVPISLAELDRNPWLLGVENGVVDLRTGQLREIEARDDYVTRRCPVNYNPNAQAPRWEKAVEEITGTPIPAERDASGNVIPGTVGRFTPRPDLARYLHKALGCSITGVIQEQKFFIGVGPGSNGKGILFDTVMDLLGPYGLVMPSEMFMATKNAHDAERPTSFAASLAGVRFVVSSETKEGQKLDVGVVKNHTGDSKLTARKMRSDPTTFAITHKPWLLTNAPPGIDHIDPAIHGRLHVIPFDRRWNRPGEPDRNPALPDGDKGLMAHLRTHEAEGILAWLVRGAMLYQSEGLTPPDEVIGGTREYFNDQDSIRLWLATLHRCPPHQGTRGSELFLRFSTWCAGEGREVKPATQTAFGKALKQHEIEDARMTAGVHYGVRL